MTIDNLQSGVETGGLSLEPAGPRRVWHLTIAYDGTDFHGWQIQPGIRTVQGELLERLKRLLRQPDLRIHGTSRTDAGVHALDQHVSFDVPDGYERDLPEFHRILNRWLPDDLSVLRAEEAPPEFHARHAACGKAYTYVFHHGPRRPNPLFVRFLWQHHNPLDAEAMRRGAAHLVGTHDFSSFASSGSQADVDPVKTIHRLEILEQGDYLYLSVLGNSFLYKMVRTIAGTLMHVGAGLIEADAIAGILEQRNRAAARLTAPPQGLFLSKVFFDDAAWRDYRPPLPPFAPDALEAKGE